jgi:hypothetical protein
MRKLFVSAALLALSLASPATAETTLCNEITSIPFTITQGGTWCLKKDLTTTAASGKMITIAANSVVIDFNDFKLGGAAAGPNTKAIGIFAQNRTSVTIRNGTIRGFASAIQLFNNGSDLSAHLIEGMFLDQNRERGVQLEGGIGSVIRDNRISAVGSTTAADAMGISVAGAASVQVIRNDISHVTGAASGRATGIYALECGRARISQNTVSTLNGSSFDIRAVYMIDSTEAMINENVLMNYGPGVAIDIVNTPRAACVDNRILGLYQGMVGCVQSIGNTNL